MKKSTSKETIPARKKIQEKEIKEKKIKEKEIKDEKKKKVKKSVEKKVKVPRGEKETSESQETKKKGFTLVELLAVVAILGIVSVIAVGAYNGITTRSKQKAYESKVSQIETSAAKWARENNIDRTTSISVNKLVVEGYLTADEAAENGLSTIKNPKNNENMICKMIEISYKNGEIQTKFIDSKDNCTLAEQALNDTKIKVVAYQNGVTGTAAALNPNSNNILPWTNKAVTLVVSSDTYKDEAQNKREANPIVSTSFDFSGNTIEKQVVLTDIGSGNKTSNVYTGKTHVDNTDAYYNVFNVDASVILDGNVVVSYRFKDGTTKSRTINVRIDKEEATASVIADSDWVTNTQKVIVKIDDGNGSGARRFYVGVGNAYNDPGVQKVELCDANGKNCKYEKEYSAPSVGEYNIWTEDMVGNISVNPKNKISVNNVDTSTPSCDYENIGTMGQGNWYITDVIPRMRTSTAGISGLYFGISKIQNGKDNPNYSNYVGYGSVGISQEAKLSDTKGQDYICYVKSLAGTKAQKKTNIKVDTAPPTITVSPTNQSSSYVKEKTITIKARDTISGLGKNSRIEYAWSTDSNNEPSTWQTIVLPGTDYTGENGPTDEKSVTITAKGMTGVYYLWIKTGTISDAAGNTSEGKNGKSINYGPFKFDNIDPECELQLSGTKGNNDWYTSNVTVSFKTHRDNDSGVKNYGISSTTGSKTASLTSDTKSKTYTGYIEDNAGNKSSCSITLKRDATEPSCQLTADGTKGNNNWYTSPITVKFSKANDATSGVVKNVIDLSDSQSGSETYYSSNDNSGTTYYGYVEDAAGNYKKCNATYKIDTTKPTCSLSVNGTKGNNDWYTSDVNVSFASAADSMSTIASKGISSNGKENYSTTESSQKSDTTSVTYTGYVKDKAGNTNTCITTFKRDATKPSITSVKVASKNSNYNTNTITLTVKANDQTSAVKKMCVLTSNNVNSCNWEDYKETTERNTGISYKNGGEITYYVWVKDDAGLISEVKKSNAYKVYKSCSVNSNIINDGLYTCGTNYGTCSNACGGTQYSTKTQKRKDKYTADSCPTVIENNSISCSQKCGGEQEETCTEFGPYGTCSDSCGGTQTRSRTCVVKSLDGTKNCKTRTDSQSQACGGKTESYGTCQVDANAPCSAICGGGVKYGTQTGQYVSTDDGKTCPLYHGTVASKTCVETCNTQSCCSETSYSSCPIRYICDLTHTYLHMDDETGGFVWKRTLTMNGGEQLYLLDTEGEYWKVKYIDPAGTNTGTYYIRRFCISDYVPTKDQNCNQICPN